MIYNTIYNNAAVHKKQIALLLDPDKLSCEKTFLRTLENANKAAVDFILVGGSIVFQMIDETIRTIKTHTQIPVLLFPGSLLQISNLADGILLLSLISGRNPDFLIGNQVIAAPFLKKSGLEIIPTAYMLIESGNITSVEYISNTKPIPRNKTDIAVATALAGQMLGLKQVYLEAGSGATLPVPKGMIKEVKNNIDIPLIVGGGIKDANSIEIAFNAGADIVVIGTAIEQKPELLNDLKYW